MSNSNLTSIRRALKNIEAGLENVEAGLENAGSGRAAVIFTQASTMDEIQCLNTFEEVANMYPLEWNDDPRNIANLPKVFYYLVSDSVLYEITEVSLEFLWYEGEGSRFISFGYYDSGRNDYRKINFYESGVIEEGGAAPT